MHFRLFFYFRLIGRQPNMRMQRSGIRMARLVAKLIRRQPSSEETRSVFELGMAYSIPLLNALLTDYWFIFPPSYIEIYFLCRNYKIDLFVKIC